VAAIHRVVAIAVLLFLLISTAGASAQDTSAASFEIRNVNLEKTVWHEGEDLVIKFDIVNTGNETGDVRIIYGVYQPRDAYTYGSGGLEKDIAPGETRPVTVVQTLVNQPDYGRHELNIMIFDEEQRRMYDSTGYEHVVHIKQQQFDLWGVLEKISIVHGVIGFLLLVIGVLFAKG
jgi:hypothetical protein